MASRTFEVDAKRPYEIVGAQRTADEFPPVARLETSDGRSVECDGGDVEFTSLLPLYNSCSFDCPISLLLAS